MLHFVSKFIIHTPSLSLPDPCSAVNTGIIPPLLKILRLVLGPALVFSFINSYLSIYGRNTRTTKTCRTRTSCRILMHGYLCVYSSYGFIICVLVGNANGTLGSTFFYYWCRGRDRHVSDRRESSASRC